MIDQQTMIVFDSYFQYYNVSEGVWPFDFGFTAKTVTIALNLWVFTLQQESNKD